MNHAPPLTFEISKPCPELNALNAVVNPTVEMGTLSCSPGSEPMVNHESHSLPGKEMVSLPVLPPVADCQMVPVELKMNGASASPPTVEMKSPGCSVTA